MRKLHFSPTEMRSFLVYFMYRIDGKLVTKLALALRHTTQCIINEQCTCVRVTVNCNALIEYELSYVRNYFDG